MAFENPSREEIKQLLTDNKTIAVVGLSDKPDRTSYMVAEAMQAKGYELCLGHDVWEDSSRVSRLLLGTLQ